MRALGTKGLALLSAFLLLGAALLVVFLHPDRDAAEAVYAIDRTVQFRLEVTNTRDEILPEAIVSTYLPVARTAHQQVRDIQASLPFELQTDEFGNQVMALELGALAPHETRTIQIRVTMGMSDHPHTQTLPDAERFLGEEPYIETAAPTVQGVASALPEANGEGSLHAAYRWVNANLTDTGYRARDYGAEYAAQHRRGDCSEFAYLFTALARLQGIPARAVAGYIAPESGTLSPHAFHNWSEIYLDGAWQIVDPHAGHFLDQQSRYVATRIITPPGQSLLGTTHRYRGSDGLHIKMY